MSSIFKIFVLFGLTINLVYSQTLASDAEIVARTILREAFEKGDAAYDAIAWIIYNRVKSSSFPNEPKDVCLQNGQFAVWKSYWGKSNPKIPTSTDSTLHDDYEYCLALAKNIVAGKAPKSGADPVKGAIFFLADKSSVRKNHPGGISIGGNYFFQKW